MAILDVEQHRAMLSAAGLYVEIDEEKSRGWICATGVKPQ